MKVYLGEYYYEHLTEYLVKDYCKKYEIVRLSDILPKFPLKKMTKKDCKIANDIISNTFTKIGKTITTHQYWEREDNKILSKMLPYYRYD